jgi:hypothetical protein
MDQMWTRVGSQLLARVSGPMKFRLVLQPAMACFFAIRQGLADAKAGKPPYFWSILSNFSRCGPTVKEGWKDAERIFLLALAMDVVYQLIVLHFVYPGEAIIVGIVLAIVPYLVLRGLVTRAARREKAHFRTKGKRPPMSRAA